MENSNKISEVTEAFNLPGELKECIPYGNGHINDTYRLTCETPDGKCQRCHFMAPQKDH